MCILILRFTATEQKEFYISLMLIKQGKLKQHLHNTAISLFPFNMSRLFRTRQVFIGILIIEYQHKTKITRTILAVCVNGLI